MNVQGKHIHFVGIGGAGLSAIARVLMEKGAHVSGSDLRLSSVAEQLQRDGAQVYVGHSADQIEGADILVVSSAIPADNVEVVAAKERGIPTFGRPGFLGQLMEAETGIAIAGTHGKTTTTAMVTTIMLNSERDPSFIVGGVIQQWNTNARAGRERVFIIEADEYDRTFLELQPQIAVITNIEHDHPDCYPTLDSYRAVFEEFARQVPEDGLLAICWDDPNARGLGLRLREEGKAVAFYGLDEEAEWRAEHIRPNFAGGVDFLARHQGRTLGLVRLRVPGEHNASNAMAALIVTSALDVPFHQARMALTEFRGVGRRFDVKGVIDDVTVIDDYAHHPTEIRATLRAARQRFPKATIWAVWQPHTFSRTKALFDKFTTSFADADHVIILPIYGARETDTLGISNQDIVDAMDGNARSAASMEQAVVWLGTEVKRGDVVLTLSAGDGNQVGEWLLRVLHSARVRSLNQSEESVK